MDNQALTKFLDIISQNSKITIGVGKNASYDDMAGALSLSLGLRELKKDVTIVSSATPLVEHSSLVGIDNVKQKLTGEGGDLIVSFPYKEGEIEKVSYTLDNGYLNIVVKSGPAGMNFEQNDVKFSRSGNPPQAMILVGTPNLSDLGSIFNADALKDTLLINIDNKQTNQGYGDVVIVNPQASTVSEMIAGLITELGVQLDVDMAQNLLNGIISGTNNFQNPDTTFDAFSTVTNMMKIGAKRQSLPVASRPSMPQQNQQNEDRVSSFMPEQMMSQSPVGNQNVQQPRPQYQQARPPMQQTQGITRPAPRAPRFPSQRYVPNQQARPVGVSPQIQQNQGYTSTAQQNTQNNFDMQQYLNLQNQLRQQQAIQNSTQQNTANDADMSQPEPNQEPPSDWLTPKVFKGSTDIQQ